MSAKVDNPPKPGEIYRDKTDHERELVVEQVDLESKLGRNVVGQVRIGIGRSRDYATDMATFLIVWELRP